MGTSGGLGNVLFALLPLVGLVTILWAKARRRLGRPDPADASFEARQAATLETERRMAAYLALRGSEGYQADMADSVQEKTR